MIRKPEQRRVTVPNAISVARLGLVPFFLHAVFQFGFTGDPAWRHRALAFFLVAALSDGVDGFLARRLNQVTEIGRLLDPVADKLLVVLGIVALSQPFPHGFQPLPQTLATVVLLREVVLLGGLLFFRIHQRPYVIQPHATGKAATLVNSILIPAHLLAVPPGAILTGAALSIALTVASAILYVRSGLRQWRSGS